MWLKKRTRTARGFAYLNEIGLIFLITRCNYPMHFTTQTELCSKVVIKEQGRFKKRTYLLFIIVRNIPL